MTIVAITMSVRALPIAQWRVVNCFVFWPVVGGVRATVVGVVESCQICRKRARPLLSQFSRWKPVKATTRRLKWTTFDRYFFLFFFQFHRKLIFYRSSEHEVGSNKHRYGFDGVCRLGFGVKIHLIGAKR